MGLISPGSFVAEIPVLPLIHDFQQINRWIHTLAGMTQLAFEFAEDIPDIGQSCWAPVFTESGDLLQYQIAVNPLAALEGQTSGDAEHRRRARQLISLACGQLRAEEATVRLESELNDMTAHLEEMYEHVSLLHNVARMLSLEIPTDEITDGALDQLSHAIAADVTLSPHLRHQLKPRLPNGEFQLQRGSARQGLAHLLSVPLQFNDHTQRMLTARRHPNQAEFGSQETLLMRSVTSMLETHLANVSLFEEKDELLLAFISSLVSAIDARDPYTRGHSVRVALLSRQLAELITLDEEFSSRVYLSGLLHDLGKLGLDDSILRKQGPLTAEERTLVEQHPVIGHDIVKSIPAFADLLPGVRHHHERWDGAGYPDRLAGNDIPLMARIMAVADAFDAMASDRPYRSGMPFDRVTAVLESGSGSQWCPEIIEAFRQHEVAIRCLWSDLSSYIAEATSLATQQRREKFREPACLMAD